LIKGKFFESTGEAGVGLVKLLLSFFTGYSDVFSINGDDEITMINIRRSEGLVFTD